jgi:hypothetical protein
MAIFRKGDRVVLTDAARATARGHAETGTVRNSPNPTAMSVRVVWDTHGSRAGLDYPRELLRLANAAEAVSSSLSRRRRRRGGRRPA